MEVRRLPAAVLHTVRPEARGTLIAPCRDIELSLPELSVPTMLEVWKGEGVKGKAGCDQCRRLSIVGLPSVPCERESLDDLCWRAKSIQCSNCFRLSRAQHVQNICILQCPFRCGAVVYTCQQMHSGDVHASQDLLPHDRVKQPRFVERRLLSTHFRFTVVLKCFQAAFCFMRRLLPLRLRCVDSSTCLQASVYLAPRLSGMHAHATGCSCTDPVRNTQKHWSRLLIGELGVLRVVCLEGMVAHLRIVCACVFVCASGCVCACACRW